MKKISRIATVCVVALILIASCSSEHPKGSTANEHATSAVLYQCPMKCEVDKTYDMPGTCPVCKMELVTLDEYPVAAPDSLK